MKPEKCLFLLITVISLSGITWSGCGKEKTEEVKELVRPIKYEEVVKSTNSESVKFSGVVKSSKESKISFKVAGTINRIFIKVGDRVRTGQVIAHLDATDYSLSYDQALAQLRNAETQIKGAETNVTTLKSNYARIEKLYENNSVPLSDFEQAKGSYETAISQYNAAVAQTSASRKQVEAAKNQVGYAQLTAPFTGVITSIHVEENEIVAQGHPIAILSSEIKPEVEVGIPETFISQLENDKKVKIVFSTIAGEALDGKVTEIAYSSPDGATYPVMIQITNGNEKIRPGMAVTVEFNFGESQNGKEYLIAPIKSIGEDTNGNFVFALSPSGQYFTVQKKYVEVGDLLKDGFEITSGIEEGELLATAGLSSLLDGMKVQLLR